MLVGEHVGLRAVTADDLPQLLVWRNRPEYRQFFREYRELNSEMQRRWFDTQVMNDPNVRMFSIVELADASTSTKRFDNGHGRQERRLLGACGLCYINWLDRSADFSIYIGADDLYIDDRFAPDAGQLMLKYGFEELGLHRVWAEIYDIDEPKKVLFKNLGFRLESEQRETHWTHGKWVNSLFYGMLQQDFSNN